MDVKYGAALEYFELVDCDNAKIEMFSIFKDNFIATTLFENEVFLFQQGLKDFNWLTNNHSIIWVGKCQEHSKSNNLQEANRTLDRYKLLVVNFLWLIKDNSVVSHRGFLQTSDNQGINSTFNSSLISNAYGNYEKVSFSLNEINELQKKIPQFVALFMPDKASEDDDYEEIRIKTNGVNRIASSPNRLERAFMFLQVARANSDVTIKISMYMALFECLFTSTNNEVSHQLAERCALYLGGTKKERLENFRKVKAAYGIRSSLMHGDKIKKTDEAIREISTNIDSLARQIFNKIINGDSAVFNIKDNTEFDSYFIDLIFQSSQNEEGSSS